MKSFTPVAVYTRKSSESDTKQEQSHDRQRTEIKSFCERQNMIVVTEFSDTKSAFNKPADERPGFMKMIKWLNQNGGHIVVMTEVTRMSRNRSCWSHMEDILHQFRFTEFGNVIPDETMVSLWITMGKSESKKIGERVKSAYQHKVKVHGKGNFEWGNPNIGQEGEKGRATIFRLMTEHWEPILIMDAYLFKLGKLNQRDRVDQLNKLGHRTRNKKLITPSSLCKAHSRVETGGVQRYARGLKL